MTENKLPASPSTLVALIIAEAISKSEMLRSKLGGPEQSISQEQGFIIADELVYFLLHAIDRHAHATMSEIDRGAYVDDVVQEVYEVFLNAIPKESGRREKFSIGWPNLFNKRQLEYFLFNDLLSTSGSFNSAANHFSKIIALRLGRAEDFMVIMIGQFVAAECVLGLFRRFSQRYD